MVWESEIVVSTSAFTWLNTSGTNGTSSTKSLLSSLRNWNRNWNQAYKERKVKQALEELQGFAASEPE